MYTNIYMYIYIYIYITESMLNTLFNGLQQQKIFNIILTFFRRNNTQT